MNEAELIDALAARADVSKEQASAVLDALADLTHAARSRGELLPLSSFGDFCSAPCESWAATLAQKPQNQPTPAPHDSDDCLVNYTPPPEDVDRLIRDASEHPLGLEFLLTGELGSVAVTFRTHIFTVEAARTLLG